jgi:Zn2+/Cd2+-exporting ATPase
MLLAAVVVSLQHFDATCAGCVERLLKTQPGVLNASVDCRARSLHIDYDSRIVSDERIAHVAHRFAPQLLAQSQHCSGRLNQSSCATCILHLARRPPLAPGIRRATASFRDRILNLDYGGEVPSYSAKALNESLGVAVSRGLPTAAGAGVQVSKAAPSASAVEKPRGMRIPAVFVGATFVLLIYGLLVEHIFGKGFVPAVLFAGAYFFGGYFGVLGSSKSLRERKIDVDILMVLAAVGAACVGAPFEGALLLFLFSLSNVLQDLAINRSRRAIRSLMKLRPSEALCRRDGELIMMPIDDLVIGDTVVVRPGEAVPLDSIIAEGESALDESSLTGEAIPVFKRPGDPVFAGTINQRGGLEIRVSKLARDSTIARLIRMVEEAQAEKANTQRFLENAERSYATGVIFFTGFLIAVPWLFFGQPLHDAFYRAMTVMVVASPCALVISTPASILSAIGGAARRGVLFKGGVYLEQLARVSVIAFDKTGTLTVGKPRVTDLLPDLNGTGADIYGTRIDGKSELTLRLLTLAASVESRSEHPLARAIVDHANSQNAVIDECRAFRSYTGKGVQGEVGNRTIIVGNLPMFEQFKARNLEGFTSELSRLQGEGKTVVLVGELENAHEKAGTGLTGQRHGCCKILGLIAVADTLRSDVLEVTRKLKSLGIRKLVMLTGDHDRVAQAIARQAGMDEYRAELLPEEKVQVLRMLKKEGLVAMVGDGINDAPALATADVGIAMGAAGTDVAMETADVVLMSDNLRNIPFALQLSRRSQTIIFENLAFALCVIVVLAASALGFHLPLPIGVVGHEGSTVLVCLNGLRLLAFRG